MYVGRAYELSPMEQDLASLFSAGGENSPTGQYINLTQRTDSWVSVPRPVQRIGVHAYSGVHTHCHAMTDF